MTAGVPQSEANRVGRPDDVAAGGLGALLALSAGLGAAALVDFAGIAGLGIKAGQVLLALAPWVLVLWARAPRAGARALEGAVPIAWVLLLAGAIAGLPGALLDRGALGLLTGLVRGSGAVAVLVVLLRHGHLGPLGLGVRLACAAGFGGAIAALARVNPVGLVLATSLSDVLVGAYLVPQLVHDLQVVVWGWRTRAWARARAALEGVRMSFLLWTLAGHLILAPSILYWSPKPSVFFGGLAAAVAVALLGLRGAAGSYSGRAVGIVVAVAVVYGVGLALLVQGGRPY